jgi:triacylglycerol esterase/lipase EstA (alpha/beta hydrolase family)
MYKIFLLGLSFYGCINGQNKPIENEDSTVDPSSENPGEDEIIGDTSMDECTDFDMTSEGAYLPMNRAVTDLIGECSERWYPSAGGAGSTLNFTIRTLSMNDSNIEIRIENLLGDAIHEWSNVSENQTFTIDLEFSGEFLIGVRNANADKPVEYEMDVSCIQGCDVEYTRYPIVFMHGLAGFDTLLNVFDYWLGVEDLLSSAGYFVEIQGVSAFDSTSVRAEQWREHLDALYNETGARKINIIAHSQGGLDARYYTSLLDDAYRVASITTIATPHNGTAIADLFTGVVDLSPADGQIVDVLISGAAELFGSSGDSLTDQLEQMTTESMATFNMEVIDKSSVQYFSWAGKSCRYLQWGCQSEMDGETVSSYFLLSHAYLEGQEGDNDGLVSVMSSEWGTFMGILPADHMDEVGHRFDLSTQPFDAAEFYLSEARRLFDSGL